MLWIWAALACTAAISVPPPDPPPSPPAVPAPPSWPQAGAPLVVLKAEFPAAWTAPKILVDGGHGAPGNDGNEGVNCQKEADVTRHLQDAVVTRLAATGGFDVRATRPDATPVDYDRRIALADGWASAMISLHTDARQGLDLHLDPVTGCRSNHGASGFAVLWSDEGSAAEPRHRLAIAIAARMREAGFLAYGGEDYTGLYAGDVENPGVFVDRHEDAKRIKVLRRTHTPTVIVETHEALDPDDVARWDEDRTVDAFAAALAAAIVDFGA